MLYFKETSSEIWLEFSFVILDVTTTCNYALGLIVARVSQVWI